MEKIRSTDKKSTVIKKLLIILIVVALAAVAGYFAFFKNADILKIENGKIVGAKSTWLTGYFGTSDGEHYYKLAEVSTPTGYTTQKNVPDVDGDPLTLQFAYAKKDTTAGEVKFTVYALGMDAEHASWEGFTEASVEYVNTGKRASTKTMNPFTVLLKQEPGKNTYLVPSPYSEAYICVEMLYTETMASDQVMGEAYAMLSKIVPAKQLHSFIADFKLNFLDDNRWSYLLSGLGVTLLITLLSGCMGVVIGAVVAAIRSTWQKNNENMRRGIGKTCLKIADKICNVYLTVIRGTPVMVQLLIMYLIIFASAADGTVSAIIAFGINSGAYVAEIIRGGIMSIDNGQFEAGRSLGFNYLQTMYHIILPQVFKNILPTLANEFIALLKETSVAGYAAVRDLNKGGEIIRSVTYSPFLPLLAVAAIYLILVVFFTWLVGKLERRLRSSDH